MTEDEIQIKAMNVALIEALTTITASIQHQPLQNAGHLSEVAWDINALAQKIRMAQLQ